ncbi:hypothetical protein, partial [Salinispira pacifica]
MENLFLVSRGLMGRSLRARARLASLLSDEHTRVTKRTISSKLLSSLDPAEVGAIVIFCDAREGRAAPEGAAGVAELIDRYLLAGGGVLALGPAELPESRAVERLRPTELHVHQTNEFSRVFDGIGNFELRDAVSIRLPAG